MPASRGTKLRSVYGRKPQPPAGRAKRKGGRAGTVAAAVAAPGLPSEQLFVRGIFRIVDVDADGLLSREEFSQLQKQLGHEVPSQEQWGRMCAALECEPQPPPGIAMAAGAAGGAVITPAAFWQLYRMSESSARADYETLAALHGGEISALLAGVAADAADGQSDASFLAVARAEDAANRRKPKRAGGASARRSTRAPGRKVQTMKSTYSKPVTVMINADNDLYGTRTNLIAEVHKRANVQSDMVAVLRDSAEQCKQEGLADKANLVEQSCAYVKQEADAIRKVVFENAVERLSARARQKTEVEEAMHAKAEADRVRQEQQHRERIVLRRQRKTRLEEERQLTIAAKQHAARALNESARHRAAQQTQQLAAVQAQQAAARVKLEAGHARVLAQQERQRQRRLAEARRARVKERAEATARKQAAEVEVEEVQKRRQVELLERALEKAKIEACREAEIEAMHYAAYATAAAPGLFAEVPEEVMVDRGVHPSGEGGGGGSGDAGVDNATGPLPTHVDKQDVKATAAVLVEEEGGGSGDGAPAPAPPPAPPAPSVLAPLQLVSISPSQLRPLELVDDPSPTPETNETAELPTLPATVTDGDVDAAAVDDDDTTAASDNADESFIPVAPGMELSGSHEQGQESEQEADDDTPSVETPTKPVSDVSSSAPQVADSPGMPIGAIVSATPPPAAVQMDRIATPWRSQRALLLGSSAISTDVVSLSIPKTRGLGLPPVSLSAPLSAR